MGLNKRAEAEAAWKAGVYISHHLYSLLFWLTTRIPTHTITRACCGKRWYRCWGTSSASLFSKWLLKYRQLHLLNKFIHSFCSFSYRSSSSISTAANESQTNRQQNEIHHQARKLTIENETVEAKEQKPANEKSTEALEQSHIKDKALSSRVWDESEDEKPLRLSVAPNTSPATANRSAVVWHQSLLSQHNHSFLCPNSYVRPWKELSAASAIVASRGLVQHGVGQPTIDEKIGTSLSFPNLFKVLSYV